MTIIDKLLEYKLNEDFITTYCESSVDTKYNIVTNPSVLDNLFNMLYKYQNKLQKITNFFEDNSYATIVNTLNILSTHRLSKDEFESLLFALADYKKYKPIRYRNMLELLSPCLICMKNMIIK